MQNIEGDTLAEEWSKLSVHQKNRVAARLAGYEAARQVSHTRLL